MSAETVFNQSCLHKQKFKSLRAAERRVRAMAKNGVMISRKNIYRCDFCQHWHLGHSIKIEKILEDIKKNSLTGETDVV